jgi:hypothetical protein
MKPNIKKLQPVQQNHLIAIDFNFLKFMPRGSLVFSLYFFFCIFPVGLKEIWYFSIDKILFNIKKLLTRDVHAIGRGYVCAFRTVHVTLCGGQTPASTTTFESTKQFLHH